MKPKVAIVETVKGTPAVVVNLPVVRENNAAEFVEKWLLFLRKKSGVKSAQTERAYRNAIKQFVNYFAESGKSIFTATSDDVYAWLEMLRAEKSASTVQTYLVAVRLFYSFLKAENVISENPAEGMKAGVKINRDIHKRDYLSVNQAQNLIAQMPKGTEKDLRNRAVVALMVTCGLRCCEVQKALYGDLRTLGDTNVLYILGKGRDEKTEYVKVSPSVYQMLQEYLAVRFKGSKPKDKDYLFMSVSRNHSADADDELSTQAIRAIVKQAMKDIGYDDSRHTAHSLRHTAATLMLRSGEELENVKQVLRHSNVQTTMIYAHALEREKNNAELAVSNLIFGETK